MSNIKPIIINPELFKMGPKKVKTQHNKTQKLSSTNTTIKPNQLKKELLEKIKNYKKQEKPTIPDKPTILDKPTVPTTIKKVATDTTSDFENEFQKSLSFLQQLSKKNKTMKVERPTINVNVPDSFNEHLLNSAIKADVGIVPYGCLKNGSKPTYRTWKNTTMKNQTDNIGIGIGIGPLLAPTIANIKNEVKQELNQQIANPVEQSAGNVSTTGQGLNLIKTKAKSMTYHLGKNNRKISVLIKNAATRKKIHKEHNQICKTTILDMKNYLRRHHLLKAGSEAPNDVIRKLYEQVLLSGEIHNSNKDNLIHNFLNKEEN